MGSVLCALELECRRRDENYSKNDKLLDEGSNTKDRGKLYYRGHCQCENQMSEA